jgi:hypothetical protein
MTGERRLIETMMALTLTLRPALRGTRALKELTMDKNLIKETMLSLGDAASKVPAKSTSTTLLMLGSTEANRSKGMNKLRPKSPVIFPKPWTIPSTIIPISGTS